MNLASIPPKNLLLLAALGIAAYYLTSRTARAAQPAGVQAGKAFFTSPAAPYAGLQSGSKYAGSALGSIVDKVLGNNRPAYQSAESDGTAGEQAAQLYYQANQDRFAVNPPDSYSSDPTLYAPTGSGIDSL